MILLNFAHPLTADQRGQLAALVCPLDEVREVTTQLDLAAPFMPQIAALADAVGLTPEQWWTSAILVVPPALNFAAVLLLAELQRRIGYYPFIVRLRPVTGALPPRYEVAEVMDLNCNLARSATWGYPLWPDQTPLALALEVPGDQAAVVHAMAVRQARPAREEEKDE